MTTPQILHSFLPPQILCAGVWHNIVLVVAAVGLGLSAPYLLQPLYHQGKGLSVIAMTEVSVSINMLGGIWVPSLLLSALLCILINCICFGYFCVAAFTSNCSFIFSYL